MKLDSVYKSNKKQRKMKEENEVFTNPNLSVTDKT